MAEHNYEIYPEPDSPMLYGIRPTDSAVHPPWVHPTFSAAKADLIQMLARERQEALDRAQELKWALSDVRRLRHAEVMRRG